MPFILILRFYFHDPKDTIDKDYKYERKRRHTSHLIFIVICYTENKKKTIFKIIDEYQKYVKNILFIYFSINHF